MAWRSSTKLRQAGTDSGLDDPGRPLAKITKCGHIGMEPIGALTLAAGAPAQLVVD